MQFRALSLVVSVMLLSSCTTPSQREVEARVDRAAASSVPEVSPVWRATAAQGEVEIGWLNSFDDPILSRLVGEAQANNPNLAAAAANVDRAQALARQAGAALSPDVGISLGADRSGQLEGGTGGVTGLAAGLQIGWEVDLWGRIRSGVAQATASAQAAQADFRAAQQSIAANTAAAYFAAIEAQRQSAIAEESLGILQEILRIVQAQYDEGVASAQDLALARSDLATARDQVASLEGSSRNAQRALELLLGRYPAADIALRESLPTAPPPPPAGVPAEVLQRRPDLVAAERQVAAAFNATNQAEAARLPSLSLTGSLGGASSELSSLLSPGNVAWNLGTSLLAPLFDGGRRRENVTIANAQQEAALASYGGAALQAFGEVENALDQGVVLAARANALQESVAEAERAYNIAGARFREGEISLVDLLTIQQRLISANSALSSVERLQLQQRLDLNLALGGDWN